MQDFTHDTGFDSQRFAATDGLSLHVRVYGAKQPRPPVICLPGLTRNCSDFHHLALALSRDPKTPRQVFALDFRGRGLSDYDPQPLKYAVPVEVGDVMALIARFDLPPAHFVGTSRGGIVTMGLATVAPQAIHSVVLNDVGPVIDPAWLKRVVPASALMPFAQPDWPSAVAYLKRAISPFFPRLTDPEWERFVTQMFIEEGGALRLAYDPAISQALAGINLDAPLPDMWPQFTALAGKPVLLLRGSTSDLLTRDLCAQMKARHAGPFTLHEVEGEGHAPLINDTPTIAVLCEFLAAVD